MTHPDTPPAGAGFILDLPALVADACEDERANLTTRFLVDLAAASINLQVHDFNDRAEAGMTEADEIAIATPEEILRLLTHLRRALRGEHDPERLGLPPDSMEATAVAAMWTGWQK